MFMNLGPQMADISVYNQRPHFNTGPHGVGTPPPLKKLTFGLCHVLSWPKLGLEPTFLNPGKR